MTNILSKDFIKSRKSGFYFMAAASILCLVAMIIYVARGGNSLSDVSPAVVTFLILGFVLGIIECVKPLPLVDIGSMICILAAFGRLCITETLFVSNVMSGIDGNTFDGAWYVIIVFTILAMIFSMVAVILNPSKTK